MAQSILLKSLLAALSICTVVRGAEQAALQQVKHHGSSEMLASCNFNSYAALGDSYSAGLGSLVQLPNCTHPFQKNCTTGRCAANTGAYGYRFATKYKIPNFQFYACSGDSIDDIKKYQVSALAYGTQVVTLTAGGDDQDLFANIIYWCNDIWYDKDRDDVGESECLKYINQAYSLIASLNTTVVDLWQSINRVAPQASIYHFGYAHFWPSQYKESNCQSDFMKVLPGNATRINDVISAFNSKLNTLSLLNRALKVTFVDVNPSFVCRRFCESCTTCPASCKLNDSFFIWDPKIFNKYYGGIYHPNFQGQGAYLYWLERVLQCSSLEQEHESEQFPSIDFEL